MTVNVLCRCIIYEIKINDIIIFYLGFSIYESLEESKAVLGPFRGLLL